MRAISKSAWIDEKQEGIRGIEETLQLLKMASEVTDRRIAFLSSSGATDGQLDRVRSRKVLIEEAIKAAEEAHLVVK